MQIAIDLVQHGKRRVGTFGDVAAFSTMYRKTLTAGASGGIVYSKDLDIYESTCTC